VDPVITVRDMALSSSSRRATRGSQELHAVAIARRSRAAVHAIHVADRSVQRQPDTRGI